MFKKLRNKLLIINTLIIAALVLSSFSVIYIMTAQNVNKSISQKLDRAIEFIRPDHNPRQKDNMQKPIDDVPPDQNGDVPPNPNTVDLNADNTNKNDKQKPKVEDRLKWSACYNLINKNETENNMSNRRKVKCMGCEYGNYFGNEKYF